MAADDNMNDAQLGRYKTSFKTPGGSYMHHEVDAMDGKTAHRMSAMQLRANGVSKDVGKWSSNTQKV